MPGGEPRRNRQLTEIVFEVEKTFGVASGVAGSKSADDGHYEGDTDSVVVAGLAVTLFILFLLHGQTFQCVYD